MEREKIIFIELVTDFNVHNFKGKVKGSQLHLKLTCNMHNMHAKMCRVAHAQHDTAALWSNSQHDHSYTMYHVPEKYEVLAIL